MGPKTTKLVGLLDSAAAVLRSCGEEHWASWLERDAVLMQAGDFEGVEHFLRAFGGMGSINDLVLYPINGHRVAELDVDAINERFQTLLSQASELARQVRNEAVIR